MDNPFDRHMREVRNDWRLEVGGRMCRNYSRHRAMLTLIGCDLAFIDAIKEQFGKQFTASEHSAIEAHRAWLQNILNAIENRGGELPAFSADSYEQSTQAEAPMTSRCPSV